MPEFLVVSLDRAAIIALVGCGATMLYGLYAQARAMTKKPSMDGRASINPVLRPAVVAVSLLLLGLGMIELVKWHVRSVAGELLAADASPALMINGSPAAQPEPLLEALRSLRYIGPHRSSRTRRILVDIVSDKGLLRLELARDSQRPDEYWVMAPKYWTTATSDAARVQTRAFDQY